jgi:hypothetical protein
MLSNRIDERRNHFLIYQLRTGGSINMQSNPIARFQLKYMSYGSWLSEYLYGFIMVAMVSGMITGVAWIGESQFRWLTTLLLVIVTFGVNITWGLIDGFTVVYGDLVDKAREKDPAGELPAAQKLHRLTKDDANTILAIMSCDALAVIPVILPYILLGFTPLALMLSILIASSALAYIIFLYAEHTGRRKWLAAGVFFVFMVIASLLAYYYGW